MAKTEMIIDVDIVIDNYNKRNPKKLPMTRKILSEKLGVNPQLFSDWKSGKKTPKWVYLLIGLMDVGKCDVDEFIIQKDD